MLPGQAWAGCGASSCSQLLDGIRAAARTWLWDNPQLAPLCEACFGSVPGAAPPTQEQAPSASAPGLSKSAKRKAKAAKAAAAAAAAVGAGTLAVSTAAADAPGSSGVGTAPGSSGAGTSGEGTSGAEVGGAGRDAGAGPGPRSVSNDSKGSSGAAGASGSSKQKRAKVHTCIGCGVTGPGMKKCSKCRVVYLCSEECNKKAWPEHKKVCRPRAAAAAATEGEQAAQPEDGPRPPALVDQQSTQAAYLSLYEVD